MITRLNSLLETVMRYTDPNQTCTKERLREIVEDYIANSCPGTGVWPEKSTIRELIAMPKEHRNIAIIRNKAIRDCEKAIGLNKEENDMPNQGDGLPVGIY